MKSSTGSFVLGILLTLAVSVIAASAIAYSGAVNVAATARFPKWLDAALHRAMLASSERRSRTIRLPPLRDPGVIATGHRKYDEECLACHGSPGKTQSDGALGMNPLPPTLYAMKDRLTDAQVYWLTKNGIKMTGMPAWSQTHPEEELIGVTAYVTQTLIRR